MASPLVLQAVKNGDIETIRALLDQGYDPNTPIGEEGELLLCCAAACGQIPIVELLLDRGADIEGVPEHGLGGPPLIDALTEGQLETARALADKGAGLDYATMAALGLIDRLKKHDEDETERWAGFVAACKTNQLEVVEYLIARGVDVRTYPPGSESDGIGASGLHWAATRGHSELVRWLVEAGTPVDIVDDVFEDTPLGWALLDRNDAMVELLVELGADISLAAR